MPSPTTHYFSSIIIHPHKTQSTTPHINVVPSSSPHSLCPPLHHTPLIYSPINFCFPPIPTPNTCHPPPTLPLPSLLHMLPPTRFPPPHPHMFYPTTNHETQPTQYYSLKPKPTFPTHKPKIWKRVMGVIAFGQKL
ncbi:hypothetical protein CISIN_1g032715mg [Citrus sinensis]|uniref:Uncharacterized protein n=1 Tax=Citrus sinensis TaxID=2711 RepID=A0A067DGD2_CITSI|nr:hypothetical protein CISIN_1g032715mg [Citrus sinensis]